jgi:hypothetical protein
MASFASIQPHAEGARSRPADARPGTLLNTDADGECAVTFASWNIRKLTTHTKDPEGWLKRKLHIISSLRALAPDFIAIQEVCSGEHGMVIFPPHWQSSTLSQDCQWTAHRVISNYLSRQQLLKLRKRWEDIGRTAMILTWLYATCVARRTLVSKSRSCGAATIPCCTDVRPHSPRCHFSQRAR